MYRSDERAGLLDLSQFRLLYRLPANRCAARLLALAVTWPLRPRRMRATTGRLPLWRTLAATWPLALRGRTWKTRPHTWRMRRRSGPRPGGRRVRRRWSISRPGAWRMRRRMMSTRRETWPWSVDPQLALWIPRAASIVAVPVVAHAERDDAQSDHCAVSQHRNIRSLIGINDVSGINPAAVRASHDVTPPVVAQTALHDNLHAGRQYCDHGIFDRWSRTKMHVLGCIGPLRVRKRRRASQQRRHNAQHSQRSHFSPHSASPAL